MEMVLIDSRAFDKDYQFNWKTRKSKKNIDDEIEENNLVYNKDSSLRTWVEVCSKQVKIEKLSKKNGK